ncbi:hypothetical protein [Photobacterium leiognathi]|uniref:hypothetical protein n=1 Tax=Photobacterium leiognathi TaxID=553611 RepID=UPI00273883F6|nr:hypothetical protein [Photobacterium leiognathi]
MNKKHRINGDIYQILCLPSLNYFSVIEIRNSIQSNTNKYGNKNNARLFVARQLQSLLEAGLIISKGTGRKKYSLKPIFSIKPILNSLINVLMEKLLLLINNRMIMAVL